MLLPGHARHPATAIVRKYPISGAPCILLVEIRRAARRSPGLGPGWCTFMGEEWVILENRVEIL